MKEFFHYNAGKNEKRLKYTLGLVLFPAALCAAIAVLLIMVNMKAYLASGLFLPTVRVICFGAAFGIVFAWRAVSGNYKKKSRNTRYTFVDVGEREIVFSKYAGEYIRDGRRIVLREVFVIPLAGLSKLGINEKNGKIYITCDKNPIRHYLDRDERLMYRFVSGKAIFDDWWYNENCPDKTNEVFLPRFFGNPELLCDAVAEAKKRFDDIPPPKKYVHKEPDFVKRRKIIREMKKICERFD